MNIKYIITLLLIFLSIDCGLAQSSMCVEFTTGGLLYYKLNESPTITYTDTELVITTRMGIRNSFQIENIKQFAYSSPTAIAIINDTLQEGPITIYSINGQYITSIKRIEDFHVSNIPLGIYILQYKSSAQKIIVK